jgi:hypothetical protein
MDAFQLRKEIIPGRRSSRFYDVKLGSQQERTMKMVLLLVPLLLFSVSAFAVDDAGNRAKFEKECAALIAKGGPCGHVPKGDGSRRGCVAKPENIEKATPECKAVIKEWMAMQKK